MEDYKLIDNINENQYEFHIEGYIPKIDYIKSDDGDIFLTHTEVPIQVEGRGIGTQLVQKSIEDIDRQGLQLVPLCPFVLGYIRKNPEWKRIVKNGIRV